MTFESFEYPEDRSFFEDLLVEVGGLSANAFLFDLQSPEAKRAEFNRVRSEVEHQLMDLYGESCQLQLHPDCGGKATEVDHLIPLSTNVLNKTLRNIKGIGGKKTPAQSFGSNHMDNLVLACRRCNAFKKHRLPDPERVSRIIQLRN